MWNSIREVLKPIKRIGGSSISNPREVYMGRYTKLRKIMLIIVVIPRVNKNIMDKDVADTITGTIINIAKGLVIPPEKNSKMEI